MRSGRKRAPLPAGFGVLWSTVAIDQIGFGMVIPILPLFAEDLGATELQAAGLLSAYAVAAFLLSPLLGALSDRIGRKPVLIVSLVGTAIGAVLTGLADSLWLLYLARVIDGFSGASVLSAQAAVTDLAEPAERPRLLGLMGTAFAVGFVVGPGLAAGFSHFGNHRLPFLMAGVLAAANALAALRRLPETRPVGASAGAASSGPSGAAAGHGARTPIFAFRSALNPVVARFVVVGGAAFLAFSGWEATFAFLGRDALGFDKATVGAVVAGIGVGLGIVQSTLVGPVTDRLGDRGALRLALVLEAGGFLLVGTIGGWWQLVAGLALLVVGQGLLRPSLISAVSRTTDPQRRGAAIGVATSVQGMVRIAGPLLAGLLYDEVSRVAPFVLASCLCAVATVFLPVRVRRGDPQEGRLEITPAAADGVEDRARAGEPAGSL